MKTKDLEDSEVEALARRIEQEQPTFVQSVTNEKIDILTVIRAYRLYLQRKINHSDLNLN
jgi:hypothetical protein